MGAPERAAQGDPASADHVVADAGGPPAVVLREVRKAYGEVAALRGVSLAVRPGELLVLLGRNGAGKTTLFAVVCGLARADAGEVGVCGRPVRGPGSVRESLGLASQEIGLYERLTPVENLEFFARLRGRRGSHAADAVDEVVDELALAPIARRSVDRLSTGERRRVHVAGALVGRPAVVVLDEPTAGVDVDTRALVVDVVARRAAGGAAVCYSTHYLSEVRAMADPLVAVLERGTVVACGPADELVARHGRSGVELTFVEGFDATAVAARFDGAAVERSTVWLEMPRPEAAVADVLSSLAASRPALRSVRIVEAGIETAFQALTGRRLDDPR